MSEQKPPENDNMGGWQISVGGDVGAIGPNAQGTINKTTYGSGQPLDVEAFKATLMELYKALGSANLPDMALMDAQGGVRQAVKVVEQKEVQPTAVAEHLKQIGSTLQQANTTIQQGSQLAASLQKIATIAAPFLGVGARVVAGWFGIPLP
jgi:hypothetical protein